MAQPDPDPSPRTSALAASDETSPTVETAPVLGPTWERHDRTHLEIALRYPVPDDGNAADQIWGAFCFLPESFRLTPRPIQSRSCSPT